MIQLFHQVSEKCSRLATETYSSSFSSAIRLLHRDLRKPVYNIYGFVRLADEIVDSFHDFDKARLLADFKMETYMSIERKLSLNPILNSFQKTVNHYRIDPALIEAFFKSMEMDLNKMQYDNDGYREYIYGSAEVVGLMCLSIFCEGNKELYLKLEHAARMLGAAFQKVNFLRDIQADFTGLNRVYFPDCDFKNFRDCDKQRIEQDIENDFEQAHAGIIRLPFKARFGVYVAYKYYLSLFRKIKRVRSSQIFAVRISIPAYGKAMILVRAGVKNQLKLI
jgi:phytoene/squalene synthetase